MDTEFFPSIFFKAGGRGILADCTETSPPTNWYSPQNRYIARDKCQDVKGVQNVRNGGILQKNPIQYCQIGRIENNHTGTDSGCKFPGTAEKQSTVNLRASQASRAVAIYLASFLLLVGSAKALSPLDFKR
jgi:hypothetical protein